jgi:hypothetical protein
MKVTRNQCVFIQAAMDCGCKVWQNYKLDGEPLTERQTHFCEEHSKNEAIGILGMILEERCEEEADVLRKANAKRVTNQGPTTPPVVTGQGEVVSRVQPASHRVTVKRSTK